MSPRKTRRTVAHSDKSRSVAVTPPFQCPLYTINGSQLPTSTEEKYAATLTVTGTPSHHIKLAIMNTNTVTGEVMHRELFMNPHDLHVAFHGLFLGKPRLIYSINNTASESLTVDIQSDDLYHLTLRSNVFGINSMFLDRTGIIKFRDAVTGVFSELKNPSVRHEIVIEGESRNAE